MLGWDIFISRQRDGGSAQFGEAIDLGGNGYPMRYTAQAKVLRHSRAIPLRLVWNQAPQALAGASPPVPRKPSLFDCPPDEWLVVEAWDQS